MSSTPTSPVNVKKVYQCPRLSVYGDIREITQQNSKGTGMQDNAIFSFLKT
jgi:hypothetical protein